MWQLGSTLIAVLYMRTAPEWSPASRRAIPFCLRHRQQRAKAQQVRACRCTAKEVHTSMPAECKALLTHLEPRVGFANHRERHVSGLLWSSAREVGKVSA